MQRSGNRFCTGRLSRTAITALIAWSTIIDPSFGQVTPPPGASQQSPAQAQKGIYSFTDLQYLLGPIALYPDPLLTLILTASAFPLQIVQADRWLIDNAGAAKQGDFSKADSMQWDPSVQALTRFPDVMQMLSDHLDWTESLGTAFSSQPEDVAAVVQMLRAKAETAGNLKSTPEQVVTSRDEGGSRVIYIAPADPERIYVPVYDSSVVFDRALTGALVFGTGVLVGSAWNNRWGWNNRGWNTVWVNPPVWQPPPPNWRPPLRPGARPPGVWRPDRPGTRPDRPNLRPPGAGPDRPGTRPDRPGARPPGARPDRPGNRPDARPPGARPDRPGNRPERPDARPPGARPDRPSARPGQPGARPDRKRDRSANRQHRPGTTNRQRPATSQPERQARPQQGNRSRQGARPQQARPQQRARPQQQQQRARPQQHRTKHRARPQQQRSRP